MVRHTRKRGGWWWSKTPVSTAILSNEDLLKHVEDRDLVVPTPYQSTRKKCTWYQKLFGCDDDFSVKEDLIGVKEEKPCRWYNPFSRNCQKSKSRGGSQRNRRSRRKGRGFSRTAKNLHFAAK